MQINIESTDSFHSLTEDNFNELEAIFSENYTFHGVAGKRPRDEMVFVDLDMSGFRADGKNIRGNCQRLRRKKRIGKDTRLHLRTSMLKGKPVGCIFDKGSVNVDSHIVPLLELGKDENRFS